MRTYTNTAWPGDPYRTGQQLYRRPAPRLAAFAAGPPAPASRLAPNSAAMVYLPLHRTRALAITEQTAVFGFHAASISGEAEAIALAQAADLDLMQARRHAAVLAGHLLTGDLDALRRLAGDAVLRGSTAVEQDHRAHRGAPVPGKAMIFDYLIDVPGAASLEQACQHARITGSPAMRLDEPDEQAASGTAAALAVERALIIALLSARHLGRYTWTETLHAGAIMTAAAWDCFGHARLGIPATMAGPR
jgi:hypothetical protein